MKYRLDRNMWGLWIIVHPDQRQLAWSGSRWMPHVQGVGTVAQISSFATQEAAHEAARQQIE